MRAGLFITLSLVALFAPLPVTVLAVCVYSFRYPGVEAVILCACIDALFGVNVMQVQYTYTLYGFGAVLFAELIRPFILTNFKEHDPIF